ncbi:hypothetical protein [Bacillus sp. RC51]
MGGNMQEGIEMDNDAIPVPSKAKAIELSEGASLVLIQVNTDLDREE